MPINERHRGKRRMMEKKNKKNRKSEDLLAQFGEIGGSCQRLDNDKKKKKKKKKSMELEELVIENQLIPCERDLAQFGEIVQGSKCYQCKCKRDYKKKSTTLGFMRTDQDSTDDEESPDERVHAAIHSSEYKRMMKAEMDLEKRLEENLFNIRCELAEKALELYKEKKGVEFEVVEPLFQEFADLRIRGASQKNLDVWCHASFTAKPKNNGDSNEVSSLKYFFAEFVEDKNTMQFIAMYCSTFDPCKDDEGNNNAHGCAVCPLTVKFHPGPDGYVVGHPPYYKWD